MKICLIGKYPPIQGGVCVSNYWLIHGLAKQGHQVHVVTNADEVEEAYRKTFTEEDYAHLEPSFESSGGFVRLHGVEHFSPVKMEHIPRSNPFVSKLASLATQAIRLHGCELIYAHYFEPYGVAGYLAAQWTGLPLVLRHAGSDLDRLMRVPSLSTTYHQILAAADGIITRPTLAYRFFSLGVPPSKIYPIIAPGAPEDVFGPGVEPLDLAKTVEACGWNALEARGEEAPQFDPELPTIGIYGKVGPVKGSYDLVAALSLLREEGLEFNFVALSQGRRAEEFKEILSASRVADRTWVLPFLPHWRVAQFNRACTAVCFLERDFPIGIHRPRVATEILACGTCLVLSQEIVEKQIYKDEIVDRETVLLVKDPKDHAELAEQLRFAIQNPSDAKRIGLAGRKLVDSLANNYEECATNHIALFRRVLGESRETVTDEGGQNLADRVAEEWSARHHSNGHGSQGAAWLDRILPWVRILFPDEFANLTSRFLATRSISPADSHLNQAALEFNSFMRNDSVYQQIQSRYPFLEDLMAFQDARLEVCFGAADGPTVLFDAVDQYHGGLFRFEHIANLKPLKSRRARVVDFSWDVSILQDDRLGFLEIKDEEKYRGFVIEAIRPKEHSIYFFQTPNFNGGRLRINDSTRRLIDACDGQTTTATICDDFEKHYGLKTDEEKEHSRAGLLKALGKFYAARAIVFRR